MQVATAWTVRYQKVLKTDTIWLESINVERAVVGRSWQV